MKELLFENRTEYSHTIRHKFQEDNLLHIKAIIDPH